MRAGTFIDSGDVVEMKDGTNEVIAFRPYDGVVVLSGRGGFYDMRRVDEAEFRRLAKRVIDRSPFDKR